MNEVLLTCNEFYYWSSLTKWDVITSDTRVPAGNTATGTRVQNFYPSQLLPATVRRITEIPLKHRNTPISWLFNSDFRQMYNRFVIFSYYSDTICVYIDVYG